MKKLLLAIAIIALLGAACDTATTSIEPTYPDPTGYVVDTANVLKPETKTKVEAQLKALDSKAQVAVVTVKSTQPLTIEEYSIKLAEKWKPGYKGQDNGVIFIIATDDRKVRIEVGRGLEGSINDAKAGRILADSVVPQLKSNNWDQGVLNGVDAIAKDIK